MIESTSMASLSDATGSIPAGWVRGVTWVPIFLYSSILTSLRKENHLEIIIIIIIIAVVIIIIIIKMMNTDDEYS